MQQSLKYKMQMLRELDVIETRENLSAKTDRFLYILVFNKQVLVYNYLYQVYLVFLWNNIKQKLCVKHYCF